MARRICEGVGSGGIVRASHGIERRVGVIALWCRRCCATANGRSGMHEKPRSSRLDTHLYEPNAPLDADTQHSIQRAAEVEWLNSGELVLPKDGGGQAHRGNGE